MYFELSTAAAPQCPGEIVFGRFEERARARRILKLVVFLSVTALVSHLAGRAAALARVFGAVALGLSAHGWWTHRHGIRFFSPKPWDGGRVLHGWS
jgi:hypothetical protein